MHNYLPRSPRGCGVWRVHPLFSEDEILSPFVPCSPVKLAPQSVQNWSS